VLRALRAAPGPLGVAAIAERLAVHPNTVRFHLDALERDGAVVRTAHDPSGRGRPAVLYRSVPAGVHPSRRYELLADVLVAALGDDPAARSRAERAGDERGRQHARRTRHRGRGRSGADSVERLVDYLDEAGFAPDRTAPDIVELHNCPFGEIAEREGRIACAVHAGMMRGALAGWGGDVSVAGLEPFARPGVCRTRLAGTTSGGSGA